MNGEVQCSLQTLAPLPRCVSVVEEYENWLQWNGCRKNESYVSLLKRQKAISLSAAAMASPALAGVPARAPTPGCAVADHSNAGCKANTELCLYDRGEQHYDWLHAFPDTTEVECACMRACVCVCVCVSHCHDG